MKALAARVNLLRAQRLQLDLQVEAGVETKAATSQAAHAELVKVENELDAAEREARDDPACAYLFKRTRRARPASQPAAGRTEVQPPHSNKRSTPKKEDSMASTSKAKQLENILDELRRTEKSAGSTKWALSGAGAAKNPPTPARKKALKAKLAGEQERVATLRAARDKLRA